MKLLCIHPGASYSTADVYNGMSAALREQGHEIIEYRLDGRIAAAGAWLKYQVNRAKRRGADLSYNSADVLYRATVDVLERALRFQPDWVLIFSAMYCHPDGIIMLKRAGLKVGVILSESPYDEEQERRILPFVDVAWTNERTCVPRFREVNPSVYYLPHAYDPAKHFPGARLGDDALPSWDVVFVGTFFQERIEILSAVDWTGIDLGLYGEHAAIPSRSKLRKHITGGVTDNATAAALYRRAAIGLNLHRVSKGFGRGAPRIDHAESLNPRAYELAASGCFQISDERAEIVEVFGGAVPTFTTADDLSRRIRGYLANPEVRDHLAVAACQAVQGHTFAARAQQITDDLSRVQHGLTAVAV